MVNKKAIVTGHTSEIGSIISQLLAKNNYIVKGFSLSTGCDLRDYSQVGYMLEEATDANLFVSCAKPDFSQTQILYRLSQQNFKGTILNIGSPIVHLKAKDIGPGLFEYATQKTALRHAHQLLSETSCVNSILWEPMHSLTEDYIDQYLREVKIYE